MNTCIICKKDGASISVTERGLRTLVDKSKLRGDYLYKELEDNEDVKIHEKCRREYTNPWYVEEAAKEAQSLNVCPSLSCTTRGQDDDHFDYPTHCIICGKRADIEKQQRNRCY